MIILHSSAILRFLEPSYGFGHGYGSGYGSGYDSGSKERAFYWKWRQG